MQFLADDDVWKEYEDSAMTVPKLLKLTGALRAEDITTLEMVVDTSSQNVTHLGELLPNLSELKLNDSRVCSFRDLGTSLRSLKVLWLARCGITDLDGISSFGSLAELYLAFNDVADVTPLAMHDQIQVRTRALGGGVDAMGGGWRGGVTVVWVEWQMMVKCGCWSWRSTQLTIVWQSGRAGARVQSCVVQAGHALV